MARDTPLVGLALLALALAARAQEVVQGSLEYAGVSASSAQDGHPPRYAADGKTNGEGYFASGFFGDRGGRTRPWLAVDLGGLSKVSEITVYGREDNPMCMRHMLTSEGDDSGSTCPPLNQPSDTVYDGFVVGVSQIACPSEASLEDGSANGCGGTICAHVATESALGVVEGNFPRSFTATCPEGTWGRYVYVQLVGESSSRNLFVAELTATYTDGPSKLTVPSTAALSSVAEGNDDASMESLIDGDASVENGYAQTGTVLVWGRQWMHVTLPPPPLDTFVITIAVVAHPDHPEHLGEKLTVGVLSGDDACKPDSGCPAGTKCAEIRSLGSHPGWDPASGVLSVSCPVGTKGTSIYLQSDWVGPVKPLTAAEVLVLTSGTSDAHWRRADFCGGAGTSFESLNVHGLASLSGTEIPSATVSFRRRLLTISSDSAAIDGDWSEGSGTSKIPASLDQAMVPQYLSDVWIEVDLGLSTRVDAIHLALDMDFPGQYFLDNSAMNVAGDPGGPSPEVTTTYDGIDEAANQGAYVGVRETSIADGDDPPTLECGRIRMMADYMHGSRANWTEHVCPPGTKGRFVVVRVKGQNRGLSLREIRLKYNPLGCDCPYQDVMRPSYPNSRLPKLSDLKARYSATSFSGCESQKVRWFDVSGNNGHTSGETGTYDDTMGRMKTRKVSSLGTLGDWNAPAGTTNDGIVFPTTVGYATEQFSICVVSRWAGEDQAKWNTIFGTDAATDTWLIGHYGSGDDKRPGVAKFGATWKGDQPLTYSDEGQPFHGLQLDDWFITCASNDPDVCVNVVQGHSLCSSKGGSILRGSLDGGDYEFIRINKGIAGGAASDFEAAELIVWDAHLSVDEMKNVSVELAEAYGLQDLLASSVNYPHQSPPPPKPPPPAPPSPPPFPPPPATLSCTSNNGFCHQNAVCKTNPTVVYGRTCECKSGYTGDGLLDVFAGEETPTGCEDVDECLVENGGCDAMVNCNNTVGGRVCSRCPPGYDDENGDGTSCVEIDECAVGNGGCDPLTTCTNTDGGFSCTDCPSNYKGSGLTGCKKTSGCAVNNGGCDPLTTCTDDGAGGSNCGSCPSGYTGNGDTGCVDRDACASNPCASGVHCEDLPPDEDGEERSPGHECGKCPTGFVGDGTTCAPNPCFELNGGCDPLRKCKDDVSNPGTATCEACPAGYVDAVANDVFSACVNEDGCAGSPCYPGVLCTDLPPPASGIAGYTCGKCPPGYEGDGVGPGGCADVNECAVGNGGCDPLTNCTNTDGGFTCGPCPPSTHKGSGLTGCKPLTACAVNNGGCDPLTTCAATGGNSVTCGSCPSGGGYTGNGDTGCVDVDGCANSTFPCFEGVECVDVPAGDGTGVGHTCGACPAGYKDVGVNASTGVQLCAPCDMSVSIVASTALSGAVRRSQDTRVIADVRRMDPACTSVGGYEFKWSAARSDGTEVVLDPDATKSRTPMLWLPKKSLPPDVTYTLRFEGWVADNPSVSDSTEFDFIVRAAPLEAVITGGDVVVAESAPVVLDAASSLDPDQETDFEWKFVWRCHEAVSLGACVNVDGSNLQLPRTSSARLSDVRLAGAPGAGKSYEFTLLASKGARRATTTSTVTVVSAAASAAGPPPTASIPPLPGGKVNAGEVARLKGKVTSSAPAETLATSWSAKRRVGSGAWSDVNLLADGFIASATIDTPNLAIAPDALESGYEYKFKLDVEDANGVAAAFVTLAENTPPSGGSISSSPTTGTATRTIFALEASSWTDVDAPIAYRFTARKKGETGVAATRQLQDFSPRSTYRGTLPFGGSSSLGSKVVLAVQAKDSLGAVSALVETEVVVTWPTIASDAAATETAASELARALEASEAGAPEEAMNIVAGACDVLDEYARDSSGGSPSSSSAAAARPACSADASDRAARREGMLNVTTSAVSSLPASPTLFAGASDVVGKVLGDPCEATRAARASGVSLIASLVATTNRSDNDLSLGDEGSEKMLSALSAAATPGANASDAAATHNLVKETALAMMSVRLGPAIPGENPAEVNATMLSFVAARVVAANGTNATAEASAGGSTFHVPSEALARDGGEAVDALLLAAAFDANPDAVPTANATRAAGTISLVLRAPGGDEMDVHDLVVPIAFTVRLDESFVASSRSNASCDAADAAADAETTSGRDATRCVFYDPATNAYDSSGCATLPNPIPPGGTVAWTADARSGAIGLDDPRHASFLWTFAHPDLLDGCATNETVSADNATRLLTFEGASCAMERPDNDARCYWRRDTQAFEGCGCVLSETASCLCNHATDFSASSEPPNIKPITVEELASVSLDDLTRTWKVFAVVGGMFGGMATIAVWLHVRDTRAKRAILRKFVDAESGRALGFAVVRDVWTWHIDVQEMQAVFNNMHLPNARADIEKIARDRLGVVDEDAVDAELQKIVDGADDVIGPEIARGVERRRAAIRRAERSRAGLPQVPNGREGIPAEALAKIEAEVEAKVMAADLGIRVFKENGVTKSESYPSADDDERGRESGTRAEKESEEIEAEAGERRFPKNRSFRPSMMKIPKTKCRYAVVGEDGHRRVPPPDPSDVLRLPTRPRNGLAFCRAVGLNYARFVYAFPMESLRRNLLVWKGDAKDRKSRLPFERAVGTAMVYAFLDVKNVVSHAEMGARIFDAAQLPWIMPTGVTFQLLVVQFKTMLSGNITGAGWMKRSTLWNILANQNEEGSWVANDSLATSLKATGPPQLTPPVPSVSPRPVAKCYYVAEELLRACPDALAACAPRLGWFVVDRMWVSLLAMEGCKQSGLKWVLNPWDDVYREFDILQRGWAWIEERVAGDPVVAAAVIDAEQHAERCVTTWREGFVAAVEGLHALRAEERRAAEAKARANSPGVFARAWGTVASAAAAPVKTIRRTARWFYGLVVWAVKLYMAAHMFFRAFLANATDSFSAAERVVMQSTMYFTALLITIWFYYNKANNCCLKLRRDIGCSANVLEACQTVEEGEGCAALMARKTLKPEGWYCDEFPDKNNGYHFLTVIAIQLAIMFPVKLTLTRLFTSGGGTVLEPHWRQAVVAAGMSMIEIYAAWLEVFYQMITDPATAMNRAEVGAFLKQFKGPIVKMMNVWLMTYFMRVVGFFFHVLDKTGIYAKRKPKATRYRDVDDVRRGLETAANVELPIDVDSKTTPADGDAKATVDAEAIDVELGGDGDGDGKGDGSAKTVDAARLCSKKSARSERRTEAEEKAPVTSGDVAPLAPVDEVIKSRRVYFQRIWWSALVYGHAGWFLAAFVWGFGGYVVLVYGVLIYRYLGPGEESQYITTWGMAFLLNTFGVESLQIIGRKAFFILIVGKASKLFAKRAEILSWYETYTELVGMHMLHASGAMGDEAAVSNQEDDGGGDGGDGDD